MNKSKDNTEVDLYYIFSIILKNKKKLILIVIIGIILSLINEKFKKPSKPTYEIQAQIQNITLFQEQNYSSLNNYLDFYKQEYFETYLTLYNLRNNISNDKLNYINSKKSDQFYNPNLAPISSKYLLDLFSRIFNENISDFSDLGIENIKAEVVRLDNASFEQLQNYSFQIKIVSSIGNLETWEKKLKNQISKINEDVRIFLLNQFKNEILYLKENHEFLLKNISLLNEIDPQIKLLSTSMVDRFNNSLSNSPINDPESFFAVKINENKNYINVIDKTSKSLEIKMLILITIITSLILGIIFILFLEALKKTKRKP